MTVVVKKKFTLKTLKNKILINQKIKRIMNLH